MSRWRCRIAVAATSARRSGVLSRIVGYFSDRGISLHEVHAHHPDNGPAIELVFDAEPDLAQHLVRRLLRQADVQDVDLLPLS